MSAPSYPPGYGPPSGYPGPPRRRGLGCFATGCVTLVILFVIGVVALGGFGWYVVRTAAPFLGNRPAVLRSYPANAAQYSALLDRFRVFVATLDAQHAATISYSADDLNDLVACAPTARDMRGRVYYYFVNNELVADLSLPLPTNPNHLPNQPVYYFGGRVRAAVAFAGGEWTFVFRDLQTLDGKPAPPLLKALLGNESFLRGFNRGFNRSLNDSFRNQINRNPATAEFVGKIRTINLVQNRLVLSAADP